PGPCEAFAAAVVVRGGEAEVHELADIRGRRVGTLGGSLSHDFVAAVPGIRVVPYEGTQEPYLDLEEGRLDGVVLDDIIAERYGLVRPALRDAGTVGEGVYAIGVGPGERALPGALEDALGAMVHDGERRAILDRWRLWNDGQATLAAGTITTPSPPTGELTGTQLDLFLRATGVTVVISVLSMALAVVGGLGLSLARRYGGRPPRGAARGHLGPVFRPAAALPHSLLFYRLAPVLARHAFTAPLLRL